MNRQKLFPPALKLAAAFLVFTLAGCEDEPDMRGVNSYFDEHPYSSQDRNKPSYGEPVIDPANPTVGTDGDLQSFSVSGGKPPYAWSVKDVARGSIVSSGDGAAVYQRNAVGDNVVIVQDSAGSKAFAVVNQP